MIRVSRLFSVLCGTGFQPRKLIPAATAKAIDREGWLDTGDIACIDADGFIYIKDRRESAFCSCRPKRHQNTDTQSRTLSSAAGKTYGPHDEVHRH